MGTHCQSTLTEGVPPYARLDRGGSSVPAPAETGQGGWRATRFRPADINKDGVGTVEPTKRGHTRVEGVAAAPLPNYPSHDRPTDRPNDFNILCLLHTRVPLLESQLVCKEWNSQRHSDESCGKSRGAPLDEN
jgi:hypothetical protein